MSMHEIDVNPQRVSGLLKKIVNQSCVDGFEWFPDVEDTGASMFDILFAIRVLDGTKTRSFFFDDENIEGSEDLSIK